MGAFTFSIKNEFPKDFEALSFVSRNFTKDESTGTYLVCVVAHVIFWCSSYSFRKDYALVDTKKLILKKE